LQYIDITTGEFAATQIEEYEMNNEIERLQPAELLVRTDFDIPDQSVPKAISKLDDYYFDLDIASQILTETFWLMSLDSYGCAHLPLAVRAAGAVLQYVKETQKAVLGQVKPFVYVYYKSVYDAGYPDEAKT
jgi:DNA mismatch repair protein MutS